MPLLHPLTGEVIGAAEGKPVEIEVLSIECRAYRDAERAYQAQRVLHEANGAKWEARDYEAFEKHKLDQLVNVTKNWRNFEDGGEAVACTKENVRSWYQREDWIYKQVFIQTHSLTDYNIEGEAPKDMVSDAEKKLETGQDGTLPSEAASDLVQ